MIRDLARIASTLMLAGILTAGCADDENPTPMEPEGDTTLQVPLAVGNRWVQKVVTTVEGSDADSTTVRSAITGTVERGGATYFVQVDSSDAPSDTTYLRQSGDELYAYLSIPSHIDSEVAREAVGLVEATMPWKVARFGAPSGTEWSIASIDTTLIFEGLTWDVRFAIVGSSRGTSAVTVPAGAWPDAQIFRLHLEGTAGLAGSPFASLSTDQDLWLVDGVGIVKVQSVDSINTPQETSRTESTSELIEYAVQADRSDLRP